MSGGREPVAGGWRLVARGWWLAARGWRLVVGSALGSLVGVGSLVVVVSVFTACGDVGSDRSDAAVADTAAAGRAGAEPGVAGEAGTIAIMDPWVRVAIVPEGSDAPDAPPVNSAAYLVLVNRSDEADALVAVETEIADTAEIHSVTMDGGVMRMRPVDSVAVPAGGEAVLEQGGYHVMLIGLRGPLSEGDTVALRLRLRSGRVIDVAAPVGREGPDERPDGV